VQLTTKKDIPSTTLANAGADALASKVVDAIRSEEGKIQSSLEDMYANMKDETFRTMRRVMTVRREKFNWSVAETRLVGKLRQ
jgi:capping protein alpha